MFDDTVSSVSTKEGIIINLLVMILAWLSPALELVILLYGLTLFDWMLDSYLYLIRDRKDLRGFWDNVTKPVVTKIIFYSILALSVHSVQMHLFKTTVPAYQVIMGIPISAELLSIATTVEKKTDLKIITKIQEIFNSFTKIK